MNSQIKHYSCPAPAKGLMNFETMQAARMGQLDIIRTHLKDGGNVNEADANGCTLIFAACQHGRIDIVNELLKQPDIHLNIRYMGVTPLAIAALNGHEACLKALLASDLQCRVNIHIHISVKNSNPTTVLGAVAVIKNWKVFSILLKQFSDIPDVEEVNTICTNIIQADQWDILKDVLQKDICFNGTIFSRALKLVYLRQRWDIVDLLFRKAVINENFSVLQIFREMISKQDWQKMESLLRILSENIKINTNLVDALRNKQDQVVEKMLKEKIYDAGTISGCLFVATIVGTNEEVAEVLMQQTHNYSEETLKYVLILAATYNRLEFMPLLLKKRKFSYKTLGLARSMCDSFESLESVKLLKFSFTSKAWKLFPEVQKLLSNDVGKMILNDSDDEGV